MINRCNVVLGLSDSHTTLIQNNVNVTMTEYSYQMFSSLLSHGPLSSGSYSQKLIMVEVFSERDIPSSKESGLSISKGETFYIKNKLLEFDTEVYIANNKHGISGEILVSDLSPTVLPEWFQVMDRQESEERLMEEDYAEGDFIIRPATRGNDGDFSVSVKFPRNAIHHFKLTKVKNKDCWSVNNKNYKSLQDVVKNFKKTPLVYKNDKKQTLRKEADTDVVTVAELNEYYDDYYGNDYEDGDHDNTYYND